MDYKKIYKTENDVDNGYAVADEWDDINDIEMVLGATLVKRSESDSDVAVYRNPDGSKTLVGNIHGPWAVDVPEND